MIQYFPIVTGSLTVTGSLLVSGGITASGGISISGSIASASYAASASNALAAQTASYWSGSITNALSASYAASASNALTAQTASYILNAVSASYAASASNALSASNAVIAQTASYANTFTVGSTLTAQTLVVQTITSSVDFVTGSTRFGSLSSNTHTFTGSMNVSGSAVFSGSVKSSNLFLGNNQYLAARNAANTADRTLIAFSSANLLQIGQDTDITALTLGVNSEAIRINSNNQLYVNTTNWPSSVAGNVAGRHMFGGTNQPIIFLWNEASPAADNQSNIWLGAKSATGATYIGGGYIVGALENATNSKGYLAFRTTDPTAGTNEWVRITSTGNVGIGITNPDANLVIGNLNTSGKGSINGASGTINRAIVNCPYPGAAALTLAYYSSAYGLDIWVNGDGTGLAPVYIDQRNAEAIIFRRNTQSTAAESMRITGGGNVGIGTSTVGAILHIYGGAQDFEIQMQNASGSAFFQLRNGATGFRPANNIGIVNTITSGSVALQAAAGSDIRFGVSTSEYMRIIGNGNVGIGTTGPVGLLQVASLANTGGGMLYKNQNIAAGTATTFFTTNNIDGWCGFAEIFGVCSVDRNRVFYKLARFAYNRVWTEMINSEQNTATTTLSYSGNDLTINIGGTAGLAYYCMIRVVGSTL